MRRFIIFESISQIRCIRQSLSCTVTFPNLLSHLCSLLSRHKSILKNSLQNLQRHRSNVSDHPIMFLRIIALNSILKTYLINNCIMSISTDDLTLNIFKAFFLFYQFMLILLFRHYPIVILLKIINY